MYFIAWYQMKGNKARKIVLCQGWIYFTACQPLLGYPMPKAIFFQTIIWFQVIIPKWFVCIPLYSFKYTSPIKDIYGQLNNFKYFDLIQIIAGNT